MGVILSCWERVVPPRSFHYPPMSFEQSGLNYCVSNERYIAYSRPGISFFGAFPPHFLYFYCRLRNIWLPETQLSLPHEVTAEIIQLVFADCYSIYALIYWRGQCHIGKIIIDQNLCVLETQIGAHVTGSDSLDWYTAFRLREPWMLMLNSGDASLTFFKVEDNSIVKGECWNEQHLIRALLGREVFMVCVHTALPELRCYSIDTRTFETIEECFPHYARENLMPVSAVYMRGKGNLLVLGNRAKKPLFVFNTRTRRAHVINLTRDPDAIQLLESGELLYSYRTHFEDDFATVRHHFLHPPKLQQIALHVLHAHMPETTHEALITSNVNSYEMLTHFLWQFSAKITLQ